MKPEDVAQARDQLAALLAAVERGELDAPATMLAHLAGTLAGLDAQISVPEERTE